MQSRLIQASAKTMLEHILRTYGSVIDLCYIDPPYNTGRKFRTSKGVLAYSDNFSDSYIGFIKPVLVAIRNALSANGVMWLHLDHRSVYQVKVMCDDVFGEKAFCGEVIWTPGNATAGANKPSTTHQNILIYKKHKLSKPVWHYNNKEFREPYSDNCIQQHFTYTDEAGRRYRKRAHSSGKTYIYYADNGKKIGSVWTDISAMSDITPFSPRRTGYPTQKPEKLLERIIGLSTNEGDWVCDPMCGSGTTVTVAGKLNRKFVGGDVSGEAIRITSERLRKNGIACSETLAL